MAAKGAWFSWNRHRVADGFGQELTAACGERVFPHNWILAARATRILDRRRLLLAMEIVGTLLTAWFALLVMLDRVTPTLLLAFTFVASSAAALIAPAWQAVVPQLEGRKDLPPAVALNSAGFNISRAIGPALAGFIIAQCHAPHHWVSRQRAHSRYFLHNDVRDVRPTPALPRSRSCV